MISKEKTVSNFWSYWKLFWMHFNLWFKRW